MNVRRLRGTATLALSGWIACAILAPPLQADETIGDSARSGAHRVERSVEHGSATLLERLRQDRDRAAVRLQTASRTAQAGLTRTGHRIERWWAGVEARFARPAARTRAL